MPQNYDRTLLLVSCIAPITQKVKELDFCTVTFHIHYPLVSTDIT